MGIKETFKKACSEVKSTAKKVSDSVKNEYKRNQLQNELDEMYKTLGKIRFLEMAEKTENTEDSEKLFDEISRLLSELEILADRQVKTKACEVCGKELPENIVYCPYCGTEIIEEKADKE